MNTVAISGNLTRDPELTTTASGAEIANIGIAVQENRRNPDQTWRQITHFFTCVAFNGQARTAMKFSKGDLASIQGRLQHRTWEAQDGSKRSVVEIVVADIVGEKMYTKSDGSSPRQAPPQAAPQQQQAAPPPPPPAQPAPVANGAGDPGWSDDDIPF